MLDGEFKAMCFLTLVAIAAAVGLYLFVTRFKL